MSVQVFNVLECTHEELVCYLDTVRFSLETKNRYGIREQDQTTHHYCVDTEDIENSSKEYLDSTSYYGLTAPEIVEMYYLNKADPNFGFTLRRPSDLNLIYKLLRRHLGLMASIINSSLREGSDDTKDDLKKIDAFLSWIHPSIVFDEELEQIATSTEYNPGTTNSFNPFRAPQPKPVPKKEVDNGLKPVDKYEFQSPLSNDSESKSPLGINRLDRWRKNS